MEANYVILVGRSFTLVYVVGNDILGEFFKHNKYVGKLNIKG